MDTPFLIVVVITAMILTNALYVIGEFATVYVYRSHISQKAAAGHPLAQLLDAIISNSNFLQLYLSTCRVGITLSSLVLGFYGQATIARWLAPMLAQAGGLQEVVAHILATACVLLFLVLVQVVPGEIVPRSLALNHTETAALLVVVPIRGTMLLFRPLILLLQWVGERVLRLMGKEPVLHHVPILSPEEIELLATESARSGLLEPGERQLLHNVFRTGELTAAKVMVPRTRLVSAPVDTPLADLLDLATSSGHTRIPLYRETIDTIVGIVHLKDLFRLQVKRDSPVNSVLRTVSYVSETSKALAVWKQLQQEKSYVAIVLDEFGGTAGMITVADLIEEIFGELRDEFDNGPALISRGLDGCVRLYGEVLIADVNEWFKLRLPDVQVNTIGGLVMATLGRLPQVGDEVCFGETRLRVEVVNGPRVVEVCLHPPPGEPPAEPDGTGAPHQ